MIEDQDHSAIQAATPAATPVVTGHAQVDDALRTLEALAELPVDEHVAVFEAAHAELRSALSGATTHADRG